MKITDVKHEYAINDFQSLERILGQRYLSDFNVFWLHHDESDYPLLTVLIKGEFATLNYMEREGIPGSVPRGNELNLNAAESTVFCISEYRADDLEVQNEAVISFKRAVDASKEFFFAKTLPSCIDWFEL